MSLHFLSDFQEGGSQYTTTESYVKKKKSGTKIALTDPDDSKKNYLEMNSFTPKSVLRICRGEVFSR